MWGRTTQSCAYDISINMEPMRIVAGELEFKLCNPTQEISILFYHFDLSKYISKNNLSIMNYSIRFKIILLKTTLNKNDCKSGANCDIAFPECVKC